MKEAFSFALLVTGHPDDSKSHRHALAFAKSAITAGHPILGVFFYEEAVRVADSSLPRNLQYQWQSLKQTQDIDLHACIGAATRRSLAEESVKEDDSIEANHLAEGFSLSGLGELAEMTANADRVIRFGG